MTTYIIRLFQWWEICIDSLYSGNTLGFSMASLSSSYLSIPRADSIFTSSSSPPLCSMISLDDHFRRLSGLCSGASSSCRNRCLVSAFRKRQNTNLPPGAFEMVDDENGETVLFFGVEDDDKLPSDEQLRWEPTKFVKPGDISEKSWRKILQSDLPRGRAADFPEQISSSTTDDGMIKKYSSNASSAAASKGLFSKLKVQTLKSRKTMASSMSNPESLRREDYSVSKHIRDDENEQDMKTVKLKETIMFESRDAMDSVSRTPRYQSKLNKATIKSKEFDQPDVSSGLSIQKPLRSKRMSTSKGSKEVVAEDFFSIRSFKDVGANDVILTSINSMGVTRPSQIQAMAYRHIVEGHSCILADQTGSGKTLAYLAPLFQRFLLEEENGSSKSSPKKPRCIIMVPTSELAAQVLSVCRSFSKGGATLKSMVATGGFRLKTQIESLENSSDIVIATPGRFLQLLDAGSLELDNLKSVVLDEVDVLFDDPEFSDTLEKIESSTAVKTQYIHVTATLPVDVCDKILESHPTSIPLMGPGLHCTATGLQEVLVDCSGEGEKTPETAFENKKKALLQLVEQQPVSKTIIFCNKIETCRKVENALKRSDRKGAKISVLPYHAALNLEARSESMQQFMESDSNKSKFLVCTDRASRGLDLIDVEHVVLFDFPRDPSEYVRRVGRTARAGGIGKAFVFVVGKQVSLARKIMVRNEKGHPIHTVPTHSY